MDDENKTKEQLVAELIKLRQQITELETSEEQIKLAEAKLRESEERFRLLSGATFEGISIHDKGSILDGNEILAEMFGYELSEVIGTNALDYMAPKSRDLVLQHILSGYEKPYEAVGLRKDGSTFPCELRGKAIPYKGRTVRMVAIRDITARKHAEEALRESEEKFKAILTGIGDLITIQNRDLDIIWANKPMQDIYGEIIGKKCYWVYRGLEEKCPDCTVERVLNEEGIVVSQRTNILPDGGIMQILTTSSPIRDAEGNIIAVVEAVKDITKRKKLEDALKESEERLQAILTGIGDLITIQNKDLDIIWANKPMQGIYGEIIGKKCYRVYRGLEEKCPDCTVERVLNEEGIVVSQRTNILPDGGIMQILTTSSPIRDAEGHIIAVVEVVKDITERKKLEDALKESEERYRGLYESSRDGIAYADIEGNLIDVNYAFTDMLGYTREELCNMTYWDLAPEKWHDLTAKIHAEQVFTRGYSEAYEKEYIRKDGTIIPIAIRTWIIEDKDGKPSGTWAIVRDISERKKMEKQLEEYTKNLEKLVEERTFELKESESRYRTTLDSMGDMIHAIDSDLRIILFNRAFKQISEELGLETDVVGKKLTEVFPFLSDSIRDEYLQVLATGKMIATEENLIIGGRKFITETRKIPVFDEGKVTRIVTVIRDITKRKHVEEELRDSEERYRGLFESSIDGITSIDLEGRFTEFNQAFANMLGYTKDELKEMNWRDTIAEKWHDKVTQIHVEQVFTRGYTDVLEMEGVKKDGTIIPISMRGWVIKDKEGKPIGSWGIVSDITERKLAEEKISESEERYRGLYDSSIDGIASGSLEGKVVECNQAYADTLGYTKEEIYDMSIWDLISDKNRDKVAKIISEQIIPRGYSDEFEIDRIKKDGTVVPASIRSWLITDKEGNPAGMWSIVRDITERKRAEEALVAEKERLATMLRSIGDGVIATDKEGMIVLMNKVAENLTGWNQEKAIGKPLNEVFHIINEKTRERCENPVEKVIKIGGVVGLANDTILIARDGTERIIADSGAPIHDNESNIIGVILVFRDVTEKRMIEEELEKVAKLESIGILAGGIAHDFNNILTTILGNISLAKMYAALDDDKALERLAEAERASMRAKALTQQLLTFSKGGKPIKKTVFISELLTETVSFALSGSNVRYEFSVPDDLWSVEIDEGQISQVINNLTINADQAMPEGGIIKVSAENVMVRVEDTLPLIRGPYVKLTIQDQGIGITKEHLSKIFDPYFSTKQKGSGLGLTVAYSIVKNHNGHITVESEIGVGSTFVIYLPASPTRIPVMKKEAEKEPITGNGRVLVMDDEKSIREALGEILNYLGYQVEFAKNGEEAIALYTELRDSKPFDVVILDLTIPGGLGGKETIKKLLEIDPKVKALVTSGYSTDPIMADFQSYGFSGVVVKPYSIEDLSEILARLIQEKDK